MKKKKVIPCTAHVRINHAVDNQPTLSSYSGGVASNNKQPPRLLVDEVEIDESIVSVTKTA